MEYGYGQQYCKKQQCGPCNCEEYVYEEKERIYESAPLPYHGNSANNHFKRNEVLGELGAVASGAFALYEARKASTDPAHASKHKHEAELGGVAALASSGYAFYEHRQKEKYRNW